MKFDYDKAKADGYTDGQIAEYVSSLHGKKAENALKKGYSPQDIIAYFTKKDHEGKILELLLCPPTYLDASKANNRWMREQSPEERKIDLDKAMSQFHEMAGLLSQEALVYLLPPKKGLQDQSYISNAGVTLPHLGKVAVLSKFSKNAQGRPGEEKELDWFLSKMGYKTVQCPYDFEGEADFKWLRENIYFGAYDATPDRKIRTEESAIDWIADEFGCNVIKIGQEDEKTYHLDCTIFPISKTRVICNTDMITGKTLREVEKVAQVMPVTRKISQYGLTNCVRIGSVVYNQTSIKDMKKDDEHYEPEKNKDEKLEEICRDIGLELIFINLSEFDKSGAALSCFIFSLTKIAFPDPGED